MSKTTQRETLEKIIRAYEAAPVQGNGTDEMISRTEYLLAKRMLAVGECCRTRKGGVDAKENK